jgi:hypothetical protein
MDFAGRMLATDLCRSHLYMLYGLDKRVGLSNRTLLPWIVVVILSPLVKPFDAVNKKLCLCDINIPSAS